MEREKSRIALAYDKLLPRYARIPLLLVLVFNMLVYFLPKFFIDGSNSLDLSIPIDAMIPFCSPFIIFYIVAYVQWVVSYVVIGRESREYCYRIVTADLLAKVVCFIFFVAMPTTITRPVADGGLFGWLTELIYSADTPTNLFPSIHCLESWVAFRCALPLKGVGKIYKWVMLFISVGVCASVVFVKQHYFIDIPAGILLFELMLLLVNKCGLWKTLDGLMKKINR